MSISLAEIFPDVDFRFSLRLERGAPEAYFGSTADHAALLAERRRWLEAAPHTYAALLPEGIPLVAEVAQMARAWGGAELGTVESDLESAWNNWLRLTGSLEPDLVLLKPNEQGEFRLVAGAVCYPSHWSLPEKMGRAMPMVHDVVPGLNDAIGKQVDGFLGKLRPGTAFLRTNWGLARHPELNDHPSRALPRLDETVRLEEVWLRLEHQALLALPKTGGVLFGIRVVVHPLAEVKGDESARRGLVRVLETMPEEMVRYKGMGRARQALMRLLKREA